MKRKVLVSGSTGQLGSELIHIVPQYDAYTFDFKSKKEFNLEYEESIRKNLQDNHYDYFINAGAYTAVDQAETDEEKCFTINSRALKWIAEYAPPSTKVIHISTDYVYNLNTQVPLHEDDENKPAGIYAMSKLLGEELLLSLRPDSIIIRTSWVYSSFGKNFVKSMLKYGREKSSLDIVSDQQGAPTYARDLGYAILEILNKINSDDKPVYSGIFNYSNIGITNWADFARKIFEFENISCKVNNISTEDYNAAAHRPLWSVMSNEKIKNTFQLKLIPWEESLLNCLSEIKN